jgi:adenylate kinase family enzyme
VYRQQTEPVLAYLRRSGVRVAQVDGVGTVEEIAQRIDGALDAAH